MKQVLSLCIFLSCLIGCSNDSPDNPTPTKPVGPTAEAGGISSGGGGTLPTSPVSPGFVHDLILKSKRDLRLYLKNKVYVYNKFDRPDGGSHFSYDQKILGGEKNIFDLLETIDIDILMDKPCLDMKGNEVDGSINFQNPDTICISAHRVAPKVSKETARYEVLALILHEISHLLGTDEEEATLFQRHAISALKEFSLPVAGTAIFDQTDVHLDNLMGHLGSGVSDLKRIRENSLLTNKEAFELIKEASYSLYQAREKMIQIGGATVLNHKESNLERFVEVKLQLIGWYLSDDLAKQYDELFDTKDSITFLDFAKFKNFDSDYSNLYKDHLYKKIDSREDLEKELAVIGEFYSFLSTYIWELKNNHALPVFYKLPMDKTQNPWLDYEGSYESVFQECKYNGTVVDNQAPIFGYTVDFTNFDKPSLNRETGPNNFHKINLYDGSRDSNLGWVTVSQKNIGSTALRTSEMGTRWNKVWIKTVYEIKNTADLDYELLVKKIYQERDDYNGEKKINKTKCVYKLQKQ